MACGWCRCCCGKRNLEAPRGSGFTSKVELLDRIPCNYTPSLTTIKMEDDEDDFYGGGGGNGNGNQQDAEDQEEKMDVSEDGEEDEDDDDSDDVGNVATDC